MRNFPHQVNQIHKIKGALQVAARLIADNRNVGDDGTFGYAVARAGIYAFRNLNNPSTAELEATIQREQRKPASDQGPRTFARDLRRTLILLGFLEHLISSDWRVTDTGQQILDLPDLPDPDAAATWTNAVVNLELFDTQRGNAIHPARNMMGMVARYPGIEKRWLAFALDMQDDSEGELNRVLALQRLDFRSALQSIGASEYMAANAVKILPSLLEQLGLLSIHGGICALTPSGVTSASPQARHAPRRVASRSVHRGHAVSTLDDIPDHPLAQGRVRSTEDQLHSAALLEERTSQHQQLVKRVIDRLSQAGQVSEIRISDDAFDVLAFSQQRPEVVLIEAKTLQNDALAQARIALGQLLFYEYFDARPLAEGRNIRKLVTFDDEPGDQARDFLAAYDVACLVSTQDTLRAPAGFEEYFGAPT
jgi:hypothetical protein